MKLISLFIMFVLTIIKVQAKENIGLNDKEHREIFINKSISTLSESNNLDGVNMYSYIDNINIMTTCDTQSWSGSLFIPDNNSIGISQTIAITETNSITDVNITINLTHTWDRDLSIRLTSPSGTSIILSSNNGSNGDDYTNTLFDDAASSNITTGTAPFNGTYIPEQLLSSFNGENPNGLWTITVVDNANFDVGTLNGIDLEICTGTTNIPPTLTASGDQDYMPGLGNFINIATAVSITDPDDISTSVVYIQIASNYVNGEDLLELDNPSTHSANGITPSWDATEGILTLTGSATYIDFEAAILDVLYSGSSSSATGVRQFLITIGETNYLPFTGHYYEFVPNIGISWTAANTAANSRTYFGLQGYLATLTSQEEADFSNSQALGAGWIGASDAANEGDWRWVTGPEAGTPFWSGGIGGSTTAPYYFAFWNGNEPNDWGNEDYAHITDDTVGTSGSWNDLPNAGGSGVYQAKGYIVEYGGTVGDAVINITATTQVTLISPSVEPEIMISQYYENGGTDYLEVKNLSDSTIPNRTYYLAVYRRNSNTGNRPTRQITIPELAPKEVRSFSSLSLKGNEIVVISTSRRGNCFADRVDIIGDNTVSWGRRNSFTKGACSSELPHLSFDINDWGEVSTAKVNSSDNRQNIAIGTYRLGLIHWDGSLWSDAALPDLSCIAIIDQNYDANVGNIEAGHLIVNATLDFDNQTTNSVVIYDHLTVNGTFIIGDTESLVMYDDNANIIGNITKKESSVYRNSTYDYTYWSSPISNTTIETEFAGVNPNSIYLFDQSQSSASDESDPTFWNTWVVATGAMIPGLGYATEGLVGTTGKQNLSFYGKPNNGIINVNVFEHNDADPDNDFNLLGNPYPSAIDIEEFFNVNASVLDPIVYLWTHNTLISNGNSGDYAFDDYATYNYTGGTGVGGPVPDKNVGSSQGFFVRVINAGTVEFNNSMRLVDANDQFFKSANSKNKIANIYEKDRIWLNLKTNKGGFNQVLVGFIENATEGVDSGYDALKFDGGNSISFYSTIEKQKFAIQGLGNFTFDKSIRLGFDTKVAPRVFSVSIENIEGVVKDSEVYLVDNLLNIIHDLKKSDYEFEVSEVGENPNRFTLQFVDGNSALSIEDDILANEAFIVSNIEGGLKINSNQTVHSIKIYDVLGRVLIDSIKNKKSFELNTGGIKKGTILLIKATLENNFEVSRKTLKI